MAYKIYFLKKKIKLFQTRGMASKKIIESYCELFLLKLRKKIAPLIGKFAVR
jgi:hypothetical protein